MASYYTVHSQFIKLMFDVRSPCHSRALRVWFEVMLHLSLAIQRF